MLTFWTPGVSFMLSCSTSQSWIMSSNIDMQLVTFLYIPTVLKLLSVPFSGWQTWCPLSAGAAALQWCLGRYSYLPTGIPQQDCLPGVPSEVGIPQLGPNSGFTHCVRHICLHKIIWCVSTSITSTSFHRYEILAANAIPKGFMDGKQACILMVRKAFLILLIIRSILLI